MGGGVVGGGEGGGIGGGEGSGGSRGGVLGGTTTTAAASALGTQQRRRTSIEEDAHLAMHLAPPKVRCAELGRFSSPVGLIESAFVFVESRGECSSAKREIHRVTVWVVKLARYANIVTVGQCLSGQTFEPFPHIMSAGHWEGRRIVQA